MQLIHREGDFDSAHRVMNELMKCFNQHGHRYHYRLSFSFEEQEEIGYAVDFKEIKRVCCQWIDDMLDHGAIYNPEDEDFILPCLKNNTKLWTMSLNGSRYCNPTVENVVKEIFLAMEVLIENYPLLKIHEIVLNETANCSVTCWSHSISSHERINWRKFHYDETKKYSMKKGVLEYDNRKVK